MKYLMITDYRNHWDNLRNSFTGYPIDYLNQLSIQNVLSISDIEVIFINIETKKAWVGNIYNIQEEEIKGKPNIRFKVNIISEIKYPVLPTTRKGWHKIEDHIIKIEKINDSVVRDTLSVSNNSDLNDLLKLKIFDLIKTCNFSKFEDYTYYILKLLGFNKVYKYPADNQRGKADGFFVFNNIAVLYDCTLEDDYLSKKDVQIENFFSQLTSKNSFQFKETKINTRTMKKFVWIITRKNTNYKIIERKIEGSEQITILEVSVFYLIELYYKKLTNEEFQDNNLEKILMFE